MATTETVYRAVCLPYDIEVEVGITYSDGEVLSIEMPDGSEYAVRGNRGPVVIQRVSDEPLSTYLLRVGMVEALLGRFMDVHSDIIEDSIEYTERERARELAPRVL